jgi:hypothetical protein
MRQTPMAGVAMLSLRDSPSRWQSCKSVRNSSGFFTHPPKDLGFLPNFTLHLRTTKTYKRRQNHEKLFEDVMKALKSLSAFIQGFLFNELLHARALSGGHDPRGLAPPLCRDSHYKSIIVSLFFFLLFWRRFIFS